MQLDASRAPSSVLLHFHHSPYASTPPSPIVLQIGQTTSEDLLCDLGSPVRSFWKEDVRFHPQTSPSHANILAGPSLHPLHLALRPFPLPYVFSPLSPSLTPTAANPYFLSHPHLGLTFLLHPTSHTLLKIILHSNLPGEVNFGSSARCAWELVGADGERVGGEEGFDRVKQLLVGGEHGSDEGSVDSTRSDGSGASKATGRREVERPMILDRAVDGGDSVVGGKTTGASGVV